MSEQKGQLDATPPVSDGVEEAPKPAMSKAQKRAVVGTGLGVGSAAIAAALLFHRRSQQR